MSQIYKSFEDRIRALPGTDKLKTKARVEADAKLEAFVGTNAQYLAEVARVNEIIAGCLRQQRADKAKMVETIEAEFYAALVHQYGVNCFNDAQHAYIYSRAWDESHSDGYSAVEQTFDSLVDFVAMINAKRTK